MQKLVVRFSRRRITAVATTARVIPLKKPADRSPNLSTGTITGAGGVYLKAPGTVTNAGAIVATKSTSAYGAVNFHSNAGTSRLIVDPRAVFSGDIISHDDAPKFAYCAPRIGGGDVLAAVRRKLDERLGSHGYAKTLDPALRLLVGGCEMQPDVAKGGVYLFRLTGQPTDARILSNSVKPSGIVAGSHDERRLGVNLTWLVLRDAHTTMMIEHTHPALIDGFHDAEATHRWTDGHARIPPAFLTCLGQNLTIEVRVLGGELPYRVGSLAQPASAISPRRRRRIAAQARDNGTFQPDWLT